jgi:hypothetical protein
LNQVIYAKFIGAFASFLVIIKCICYCIIWLSKCLCYIITAQINVPWKKYYTLPWQVLHCQTCVLFLCNLLCMWFAQGLYVARLCCTGLSTTCPNPVTHIWSSWL